MENVKITQESKTLREIEFRIDEKSAEESKKHAVGKLKGIVKIPGFRSGKVPDELIEKYFPEDLKSEQENFLVAQRLHEFVEKNALRPVTPPELTGFTWNAKTPEKFSVKIEIIPEFDVTGYKKITLKTDKKEIDGDDVKKALEDLRERAFSLKKIEAETLSEGLFIKYDLEVLSGGISLKTLSRKNLTTELKKENLLPALWPEILDSKKGIPKDIAFIAPENFHEKTLAGKKITFRIKITEILEKVLPEVDDKFAGIFGAENAYQLKESVETRLKAELELKNKNLIREQINEILLKKNKVEIPKVMVETEKKSILENLKKQYPGENVDKAAPQAEETAEKSLKLSLLLGKIAEKEQITVTDEELKEKLGKKYSIKYASRIKDTLLTDKIFDFIIKEGKIK
ncbi:MAG: trigger factor [bacterium]